MLLDCSGLASEASNSVIQKIISQMGAIPPADALMAPRSHVSPIPLRHSMLPQGKQQRAGSNFRPKPPVLLGTLLLTFPPLIAAKRRADYKAERAMQTQRPAMLEVAMEYLTKRWGGTDVAREKLAQLRAGCAYHVANHPRVAVFVGLSGLDPHAAAWSITKISVCLILLTWLTPAADAEMTEAQRLRPTKAREAELAAQAEARMQIDLGAIDEVLEQLRRKRLLHRAAVSFLREVAVRLQLPSRLVDIDTLILSWMKLWGGWEYKVEDKYKAAGTPVPRELGGSSPAFRAQRPSLVRSPSSLSGQTSSPGRLPSRAPMSYKESLNVGGQWGGAVRKWSSGSPSTPGNTAGKRWGQKHPALTD